MCVTEKGGGYKLYHIHTRRTTGIAPLPIRTNHPITTTTTTGQGAHVKVPRQHTKQGGAQGKPQLLP